MSRQSRTLITSPVSICGVRPVRGVRRGSGHTDSPTSRKAIEQLGSSVQPLHPDWSAKCAAQPFGVPTERPTVTDGIIVRNPNRTLPTILNRELIARAESELYDIDLSRFEHVGTARRCQLSVEEIRRAESERYHRNAVLDRDGDDAVEDAGSGVHIHVATGETFRRRPPSAGGDNVPELPDSLCGPGSAHHSIPQDPLMRLPSTASPRGSCIFPCQSEEFNSKVRLCPDFRGRIDDTTSYPYRAIVKLIWGADKPGNEAGTGALIGPKHVLTAAHVFWFCDPNFGCGMKSFGSPSFKDGFGIRRYWRWFWLNDSFHNGSNVSAGNDYALVTMKEFGTYSPGCFRFASAKDGDLAALSEWGYPKPGQLCKAAPQPLSPGCAPYGACDGRLYGGIWNVHILGKKKHTFRGDFNAQEGQSGAPVYKIVSGVPTIYGVHVAGTGQVSTAKRLSKDSVATLKVAISDFPHTYWGVSCTK